MPQAMTPGGLVDASCDEFQHGTPNHSASAPGKQAELVIRNPRLPHITQGFIELRLLASRLVQDSHNRLQGMVGLLAEGDRSDGDKKARIIEHMLERRKQFIKLLVLTMWAKNAQAVSEVIDLKVFLDTRQEIFHKVVWNLYEVRRKMSYARIPNPDLDTAVRVLSTGRANTAMTRRYVPRKKLTSKETLKVLRDLNTLLSLRLALHEKLPTYFRDYTIASGRATFTVADEFEADLCIGDEDPKSQLYLVDFRFIFEPSVKTLPASPIRDDVEGRGNIILKQRGLEGIYDYLHEFVMTDKICTLARQFKIMLTGRWTENLVVNMRRRTLVVQYWISRAPEGETKSWIEVGVKRGTGGRPSRLGVRWIRDGKAVQDQEVPLDVAVLSAENLIKTVIAMHTKHILTSIQSRLAHSPVFPLSAMVLTAHPTDSFNSSLKLQLTPSIPVKLLIEPITGRFALHPPAMAAAHAPTCIEDLIKLKFVLTQEEVETRARSMGWEVLKMLKFRKEELKGFFPSTTKYISYLRREGWGKEWVIAMVLADTGQTWWVAKVHEAPSQWSMSMALEIPVHGEANATYGFLGNLEKMSSAMITLYVNQSVLVEKGVQHKLQPSKVADPKLTIPDLYIRFSSLIHANWGIDVLRLTFQGLGAEGKCIVTVLGRTKEPMTQLGSTNISAADSDVSFHPQSGSYAIRFNINVGESVIEPLVEKLHRIERLIRFVAVIRRFNLPCLDVSLGRIAFTYDTESNSSAEVSFSGDREMKLHLPPRSPHIRIKGFLEHKLNVSGLETVVMALTVTLPLLLAFERIEAAVGDTSDGHVFVLSRSVDWFRIYYRRLGVVLDWQLQCRKSVLHWFVRDAVSSNPESEVDIVGGEARRQAEELRGIWSGEVVGDWEPLKSGAAAGLREVGALAWKIHELIYAGMGVIS
ncbi:MED14-domain-containing protein [Tuber magnatum]|uniref:Mediator of RNA polymerase II transcription subunit 14 n=1 Tax=Tuber magnatum TaxID=42249 RepID=A0A317SLK2_9PEZI|nr:MED14-domain-containing protein [Tuber magnatum]